MRSVGEGPAFIVMESVGSRGLSTSPHGSLEHRSALISEAAVERGRVNNALEKLRVVEAERSRIELQAANQQMRMEQQFALDLERKETNIMELERLLAHAEAEAAKNETQLASSTWQQGCAQSLWGLPILIITLDDQFGDPGGP